jgi:hypothetical protein
LRYGLSYRDVEELLAERGINVDHVSVFRWVQRFTPEFIEAARVRRHALGDRWFADETRPGWRAGSPGVPGPDSPSFIAGTVHAGQGACGSASMRCHAAVIIAAHGQAASPTEPVIDWHT